MKIALITSRFNPEICDALAARGQAYFAKAKVPVDSFRVPGAFELGVTAKKLAQTGRYNAIVCCGVIIRGETDHYEHVAAQCASAINQAGMDTGVPVIFGVITCGSHDLAKERAGLLACTKPTVIPDWPFEAAVKMATLFEHIKHLN